MVIKYRTKKPIELKKIKMDSLKKNKQTINYKLYQGILYIKQRYFKYISVHEIDWNKHETEIFSEIYLYLDNRDGISHEFDRILQTCIDRCKNLLKNN